MATSARNRRLEPAYKQHTAVDDVFGVVLDVEVTTGQANEGDHILPQVDAIAVTTGAPVKTVTADQGYAYGKVYGGLERRGIDPVIPAKKELIRSRVPLRRFRYDTKHDILKCPKGHILRPQRPIEHGRFFYSRADIARCEATVCRLDGLIRLSSSATTIRRCCVPAAEKNAGPRRTHGSTGDTAGDLKVFMARPSPGTDWQGQFGADYRTCVSRRS
jgi:hypothetical protein